MKFIISIITIVLMGVIQQTDAAVSKALCTEKYSVNLSANVPQSKIQTNELNLKQENTAIRKQPSGIFSFLWMIISLIIATILPPLAVLLYFGVHRKFWVNVLLTILGFVPGVIHAWVVIIKGREARKQRAV